MHCYGLSEIVALASSQGLAGPCTAWTTVGRVINRTSAIDEPGMHASSTYNEVCQAHSYAVRLLYHYIQGLRPYAIKQDQERVPRQWRIEDARNHWLRARLPITC